MSRRWALSSPQAASLAVSHLVLIDGAAAQQIVCRVSIALHVHICRPCLRAQSDVFNSTADRACSHFWRTGGWHLTLTRHLSRCLASRAPGKALRNARPLQHLPMGTGPSSQSWGQHLPDRWPLAAQSRPCQRQQGDAAGVKGDLATTGEPHLPPVMHRLTVCTLLGLWDSALHHGQ